MTAIAPLARLQRAAARRAAIDMLAIGAPGALALAAIGWRFGNATLAVLIFVACALLVAAFAYLRARRFDCGWLVGQLDARVPAFEDSSALLFGAPAASPLAALQRQRIEVRIDAAEAVDFRPAWSHRAIVAAWVIGAAAIVALLLWPDATETPTPRDGATATAAPAMPPTLAGVRLRITPPAYTGLPARTQSTLDARVPEGSRIDWSVAIRPPGDAAAIAPVGGNRIALVRQGDAWTGGMPIDRAMLYRIEAPGLPRQRLHRIETVADAPPVVRVVAPERQLAMLNPGQRRWTPVFEATDDHGIADATLRVTVTKGDGENISFEQRSAAIAGSGPARRRRFAPTLDIAREGMAPGSDLIVQIIVADNRAAGAQRVEGPSAILRWPPDLALADGLDGMAAPVMPAYFRSQRQIIIDAEALIARRARIPAQEFADRSNGLGNDQASLRLRYGQFVGEEAEGGGSGIALPTNDAPALPTNNTPAPPPEAHSADDGHDHGSEGGGASGGFGSAVDVLNEFGHAHDSGDAATLFDPGTRSTLAQALDAMWSSERALRQGDPQAALPHAYRALAFLKDAQQATRIFVPRTGAEPPPIDLSRRLTGDREGIVAREAPVPARPTPDATPAEAWRALQPLPGPARTPPLQLGALDRWVRQNAGRIADPLALSAAIDTLRAEPACTACRERLRALLWRVITPPRAGISRRAGGNARGRRYLEALR
ncbi:DUF4175 family protein [Sphingomonas baiyangensis]|uniref:DUF4175 domain-containing protein n=1 Tax=Sphingomonas baiyangensis TaxID=2572576 RepID=A0A4U1L211_9SPHN|nr:DUF4175 family protein [Sphingomonas baiyangensis]TKD50250.1 DUF4175 domain-containing protein [Sphingomonas baiyangensis]